MADFHHSVKDEMSFHQLLPGYNYSLQDPSDAFYSRQQVSFQAQQNSYTPNVQAMLNLANNEAFLDVDNSYFQAIVTLPQQFVLSNTANSEGGDVALDQLLSSIISRMVVKCGGQTLVDLQYFNHYHHTRMLFEDNNNDSMGFFSENQSQWPVGITAAPQLDYTEATMNRATVTQSLLQEYGQQLSGTGVNPYYNNLSDCIRERCIEDLKRNAKFYQLTIPTAATLAGSSLNGTYAPRSQNSNDMNDYVVLFKLSDLPCFDSKQYFPLFAINGPVQFQFTWNPWSQCSHNVGFIRGTPGNTGVIPTYPNGQNYTVWNLELVTSLIYPKPDFVDKYMIDVVAGNEGFYKCEYVDASQLGLPSAKSTLLYNVSMARLTKSIYLKLEQLQDQVPAVASIAAIQEPSSKRYVSIDTNITGTPSIGGFNYRGYKWYSPWGDMQQIYTRVNGITYPLANSSVLINEHLIKEQTEEVMGKMIGLSDTRRFFFDQQVLAFSYKKDTHSHQMMDVSGINTANNNQLQLVINLLNQPQSSGAGTTTQILGIHYGEQVLQFTPQGSLLLFR